MAVLYGLSKSRYRFCFVLNNSFKFDRDISIVHNSTFSTSLLGHNIHSLFLPETNCVFTFLDHNLWPLLLTWFNFNPSMDK